MNNTQKQSTKFRYLSLSSFFSSICSGTTLQRIFGTTGLVTILVSSNLGNHLVADTIQSNVGSHSPKTYESIAKAVSKEDALEQLEHAKVALENGNQNSSELRSNLGLAYQDAGLYEEALAQFLWCLDEGPNYEINLPYRGVRRSYLLGEIRDLAKVYTPAMDALIVRRDDQFETILKNDRAYRRDREEIDRDFAALAQSIGDNDYIFSVFDRLQNDKSVDRTKTLSLFVLRNLDSFDEHGLFDVIVKYVDMRHKFDSTVSSHLTLQRQIREDSSEDQEFRETMAKAFVVPARNSMVNLYKILLATERLEDARYAAERVIELFDSSATYNALAAAGIESNKPTVANVGQARTSVEMEPANAIFVNTLVQLLHATGDTSEAVRIARDFLGTGQDPENRSLIEDTLQDLQ